MPVYALFFATGAFGLVYEVVWSRYLGLLMGSSAEAHAVVLATFMGGLALGGWVFGRVADRVRNRLRLYGWLEVAVGLYGIFFPDIFQGFTSLMVPIGQAVGPGTPGLAVAKLLLAALCVLPPAVLMGGTLPIMTRHLTASPSGMRQGVASLYGINSLGAVVGGLLAGFLLLEALGLPATVVGTGLLNALVGLLAVGLSIRLPAAHDEARASVGEDATEHDARARRMALGLAAFSGFATMTLQVAWIRWFGLMLGSSSHAFTLIVAAFITGIGLGALWLSRPQAARWPLLPLVAGALVVTTLALTGLMALFERMPFLLATVRRAFALEPHAWPWYQVAVYGACFLLMALPTFVAGLVFPATVRLASRPGQLGRHLGRVYAVNTAGTLLGALLTALFFFQWFGLEVVLRGVLVAYGLAAAVVGFFGLAGRARVRVVGTAGILVVGHLALYAPTDPRLYNEGLYRRRQSFWNDFEHFRSMALERTLLFAAEGPHASVVVREQGRSPLIDAPLRVLAVNGKPDASTGADMVAQTLLAHLPLLVHPDPKRVFLVGLGSGVTAGAATLHDVDLDVAEISAEVVAAEPFFRPWNHHPFDHPRTRLVVEDARTVLRYRPTTYDVIISEPTNPWQSGVAGLFTLEFFEEVKARLAPGGLFTQWMHGYEADDATLSMVVSTICSKFRHVMVFEIGSDDYLFLASDEEIPFDPEGFARRFARPTVAEDLARIGISHPFVLLALQLKAPGRLEVEVVGELNSDLRPLLELQAPRAFFVGRRSTLLPRLDDHHHLAGTLLADRWHARFPLDRAAARALASATHAYEVTRARRAALLRLLRTWAPDDPRVAVLERESLAEHPGDDAPVPEVEEASLSWEALRARFERAILVFEGTFHRWAPPPVEPLERTIEALAQAAGADPGRQAVAARYRLRLLESVCARALPACARQSAWFATHEPQGSWRLARVEEALVQQDLGAVDAWLANAPMTPRTVELAARRDRLAAVREAEKYSE